MLRMVLAVLLLTVAGAPSHSAVQPPGGEVTSIEGVWRIVEAVDHTNARPPNRDPQPSQIIYTKTHYSFVSLSRPRPQLERPATPGRLTDAEKIARYEHWYWFTAHAGTYEYKDGVVTTRAVIAKNDAVMRGEEAFKVKSEDGLLWLVSDVNEYTLKLKRVE